MFSNSKLNRRAFAAAILLGVTAIVVTACNTSIPCGKGALRYSAVANHSSWMEAHLSTLGNRGLSRLVLPASHDAAMYRGWFGCGQTQCLSVYEQLLYGIRWFDLRPEWTGRKFVIHHGPIRGPDLSEVLNDVNKFASGQRHELIVLKLSHFEGIHNDDYVKLAAEVTNALAPWLFKELPGGKRLANITLSDYVRSGSRVLVLVDDELAVRHPLKGIWVYGDWNSPRTSRGDLWVYDQYSNTTDFDQMAADQYSKFQSFQGKGQNGMPDCDMFLLSWTLTPRVRIWAASKPANQRLEHSIKQYPLRNKYGRVMNLIYVDFVECANVTDVAIAQNERLTDVGR